jgi:ACS family tartrate transporter-like MFS transporter
MNKPLIEIYAMRKIWWRVIPLMAIALLLNLIDRANISFAALQMNTQLGFSKAQFGLGAGFLAVGILIFGIPSTLLLHRLGARRWISVTLLAWGIFSGATAFVSNVYELIGIRLLLGVAEAGFIPGAIYYFSYWFPTEYRGRVLGSFIFMQPIGLLVGAPISAILVAHGAFGLAGWQSMFLIEAVPTLLLALAVYVYLTDSPAKAAWLSVEEKGWLADRLEREQPPKTPALPATVSHTFANHRVHMLALAYFAIGTSGAGAAYFLPLIIQSMGFKTVATGALAALPPLAAALSLPLWGSWADRSRGREFVVACAGATLVLGLLGAAVLLPSAWALAPLCLSMVGFFGFLPTFWTLPYTFLVGASAAAGIAFINIVGSIGNLSGPYLLGRLTDKTGSFSMGLVGLAICALFATLIMLIQAMQKRTLLAVRT